MKLHQAQAERILELCNQKGITKTRLATLAGLVPSTLNYIISGKTKNIKSDTILLICEALEISLSEFYDSKLFTNLEY